MTFYFCTLKIIKKIIELKIQPNSKFELINLILIRLIYVIDSIFFSIRFDPIS